MNFSDMHVYRNYRLRRLIARLGAEMDRLSHSGTEIKVLSDEEKIKVRVEIPEIKAVSGFRNN